MITCEPHVSLKIKKFFAKVRKGQIGTLTLSATDENSRDLEWFLERFPMEIKGKDVLEKRARDFDKVATDTWHILSGHYAPPEFTEMALPPRDYQKVAAQLALTVRGHLLADELGLGKTVSGLTMLSDPRTLPALVVCPTHLPNQWEDEVHRFLPHLTTHITKKGTPYKIGDPDIIITNYHKLAGWADHLAPYINSVIYDEVQELRRDGGSQGMSNKYSAALALGSQTNFRLGLSATPIYNYGAEFYAVFQCLAPGKLGSKPEFLREWCSNFYDERKAKITDPKAFGAYLRESGMMLLRTKSDVGRELPPLSKVIQEVESNTGHLDDIKDSATELASFIVNSGGAKGFDVMRASQELSNKLRQATGIAKAPYVADFTNMIIESTGDKVVLFGWHREVYNIWAKRLGIHFPAWYTGSESVSKKRKELNRFINDPNCKVLMMSLRSGSGVDGLQHVCSRVVIGELDWSPGAIEQCIGRVYRDGQLLPVFAYYPIATDGCDPVMVDVLGIKRAQLEGVKNPDGKIITASQIDPNHVKRLAESYLRR